MPESARRTSLLASAFATRLAALAAIFTLCVLTQVRGGDAYSERQLGALYALVLAGFLLSLAYGALAAWSQSPRLHLFELVGDALLVSGFVYCSGGVRSIFGFLFLVWIVYAALTLGSRGAMLACACAVVAYSAVVWGPVAGWLPAFDVSTISDRHEAGMSVAAHALAFLAVAVLARRLASEIQAGRRELHELGEIHRRIVDSVSSGLLTVSRGGEISSFNREAERITGWPASAALGERLERLFPALGSIEAAGSQERLQVRFESRDGRRLHLGMSVSGLRDPAGRADGAILIFQDLTRVVEMEEELRRSERLVAVGQLATGLAHEIRNPLASLSGAIELLTSDLPSGDRNSETLALIVKRETSRLNRLVSDFLTYARPGPGRFEPVELARLFEELRALMKTDDGCAVELDIEVPNGLCALGNSDQLRQVFWNLVLNAAQSEPVDGVVRVRASKGADPRGLEICVEDRGCGFEPEALERIYEPFFTTKPKGTGLGLATVQRVVEAHGGRIAVASESGKGTTVRVFLPSA
jgi:two-component system sensor histidine kinase PilS (NtrC family)